ncbi:MAG TPA: hypothetical protein VFN67_37230, partial [Polyangiales bacterium]|nr:hypothetical protein [Polyangiales bacterium]
SDHAVFRSESGLFDDVALLKTATGPIAFFSDASGLYARAVDESGLPRNRAERIAERCDAGLAAAVSGKDVWIACSRRAHGGDVGSVTVYNFAGELTTRQRFAPVGGESQGVALAVSAGRVHLAWQDAALGGAQLRYAEASSPVTNVISDPSWFASTPQLSATDSQLLAVWDESQEHGSEYESRVRMLDLSGRTRTGTATTVMEAHDASPSPAMLVDRRGGSWVAFRDRRKGRRKTGLYLAHLSGSRASEVVRVGRADGVGRPTLTACLSGLVAATPRTFAGDYFVGVVQVDPDLETFSLEQQFYEDSHEFSQVAATCLDARLLLLIAERGRLGGGRAALRSVGFSCE